MPLRREILRFPRPDGGLDLLDPLLDRLHRLDADEAAALDLPSADGDALFSRLERALLLDGPIAEALRERAWAARTARPAGTDASPTTADWTLAARMPPEVSSEWRDAERC